jgi:hypothetical protein
LNNDKECRDTKQVQEVEPDIPRTPTAPISTLEIQIADMSNTPSRILNADQFMRKLLAVSFPTTVA